MDEAQVDILVKARDQASRVLSNVQGTATKAGGAIRKHWGKIAGGAAIAGGAMEMAAQKAAEQNEQIDKLAQMTDMHADAVRNAALETANYTRPVNETLDLMKQATKQGIKGKEALNDYAVMWDTVGDATGESSVQLAKASQGLRVMGVEAGNEEEAMAALGHITNNTSMEVSMFMKVLERVGPDIREMNMNVDQTAAVMSLLNKEGYSGQAAMQEFRQATSKAKGDQSAFLKELGLTEEALKSETKAVKKSENVINDLADAHAEHYTVLQKAKHWLSELTTKYGGLIEAGGNVAPVLLGIAAVMPILGTAISTSVLPALGAMWAALAPLLPILLPIAGVVALVATAWKKNWGDIQGKTSEAIAWIKDLIGPFVESVKAGFAVLASDIQSAWAEVWPAIQPVLEKVKVLFEAIFPYLKIIVGTYLLTMFEIVKLVFKGLYLIISTYLKYAWAVTKWVIEKISSLWTSHGQSWYETIKRIMTWIYDVVYERIMRVYDWIREQIDNITHAWDQGDAWYEKVFFAMKAILSAIRDGFVLVMNFVARKIVELVAKFDLKEKLRSAGIAMLEAFIGGLKAVKDRVVDTAKDVVQGVRDLLPGSDAKEGPLSDITESGRGFIKAFIRGMKDEEPALDSAMEGIAGKAGDGLPSPGGGGPGVPGGPKEPGPVQGPMPGGETLDVHREQTDELKSMWEDAGRSISDSMNRTMENVFEGTASVRDAMTQLGESVKETLVNTFLEMGKQILQTVISKALQQSIANIWASASSGLGNPLTAPAFMAQATSMIGMITGILSGLPGLAEGGIVTRPTVAMLGEKGPEKIIPLDREQRGPTVVVNNNVGSYAGSPMQGRMWARDTARFVYREQQRKLR